LSFSARCFERFEIDAKFGGKFGGKFWIDFSSFLSRTLFGSGFLNWLCLFNWLGIGIHRDEFAHDRRFYS
jgi:hypothetical protein